ncbi:hypothetical protein DOTSEDRAFT_56294 [Dothistroma septosporum NZE10]|uniref:Uncharacterized protein n=1 Tax=Dothistroma septosporum (strain NZE10 / CBS 128990) TaxID=675120 RepID=N1PED4_DOTSN|nr:hypothetical protein DOTSEDRAFT_56294 [Dothistroma septosporum NZE10]
MVLPLLAKICLPNIAGKVLGKAAAAAVVLIFLCFFAGLKPGMLDGYAVYTVNVSRIGENLLTGMNQAITGVNITKHSEVEIPRIISIASRDDDDNVKTSTGNAASSTDFLKPTATAEPTSAGKTIPTRSPSKPAAVTGPAPTAIVNQVNEAFGAVVDKLTLHDFYDFHVLGQCYGSFISKNGSEAKNVTTGAGPTGNQKNFVKKVIACERKSSALTLTAITYGFTMICTSAAFVASIASSISYKKRLVLITLGLASFAFLGQLVSSAAAHAIANSATGLVDFVGHPVGIDGSAGKKFITLTWAATILLALVAALWGMLLFVGCTDPGFTGQGTERLESVQHEQYTLPTWPQHAHASHVPTARSASVYSGPIDGFVEGPTYPGAARTHPLSGFI